MTQKLPLKIFISYSHKDEKYKNEMVTMLAGLQRRRMVDTWQDRQIEPGDEWNKSIQNAMDECDLALLLVSPDYLHSFHSGAGTAQASATSSGNATARDSNHRSSLQVAKRARN